MSAFEYLKSKFDSLFLFATAGKLRKTSDAAVLDGPGHTIFKVGDLIPTASVGISFGDLRVTDVKAGGYAIVYIVSCEETRILYALKTFQDWCFHDAETLKRFTLEAEAWIRLEKHPNIVYAHSVIDIHGRLYIVLEYVDGPDLWDKMKNASLSIRESVNYAIQFCRGMDHAQKRIPSFVHRDIKPPYCLITKDGVLKITDFGHIKISANPLEATEAHGLHRTSGDRSTRAFQTPKGHWGIGTPPYMAPEQFEGSNHLDVRSDIYSFGIMLFEMLTGDRPFDGESHEECCRQHNSIAPPDPLSHGSRIPRRLADLVLCCLAKSPADRPANFSAVEDELNDILFDSYQEKRPISPDEELTYEEISHRGLSLMALGHHEEAVECFDQVLATNPGIARAWSHKSDALTRLGRYEEALACAERALTLDPQLTLAWSGKGNTLTMLRRYDQALTCFDRALALRPNWASLWTNKAQALTASGRFNEALTCLNRALALDPQGVEAHNNAGLAYNELGRRQEAIEAYKQALRLNPNYVAAHNNLGTAYLGLGRLKDAIVSYQRALSLRPGYHEARHNLGKIYRTLYPTSNLLKDYENVLNAGPGDDAKILVENCVAFLRLSNFDPMALNLCGQQIYEAVKRIDDHQKETLTKVLDRVRKNIHPAEQNCDPFFSLSKIYYGLDLYDESLKACHQSARFFGLDDRVLYCIAACNEVKRNYPAALDYYKQALSFDPGCPLTSAAVSRMERKLAEQSCQVTVLSAAG